jgi:hypothetical protein
MAKDVRGPEQPRFPVAPTLALVVGGVGLGVLTGMSATPVIEGVITALLGIATGLAAISAGMKRPEGVAPDAPRRALRTVDPAPVAGLLVGIAIGSMMGVHFRTHQSLSPSPADFARRWSGADGMSEAQLRRRLLDTLYPVPAAGGTTPTPGATVLFGGVDATACERLTQATNDELPNIARTVEMSDAQRSAWADATGGFSDVDLLRRLTSAACEPR